MVAEDLHILDIAETDRWVQRAADVMQAAIDQAIRLRGRCLVGLSGGSTPGAAFEELASRAIEWDKVFLLQVDERVVPNDSEDRNLTTQQSAFVSTGATWLPLPADEILDVLTSAAEVNAAAASDAAASASTAEAHPWANPDGDVSLVRDVLADFDAKLVDLAGSPPILDVVHLGLGHDGHTASLLPGDAAVDELLLYSAVTAEYDGARRVTLTRPLMDRARMVIWLVRGADKRKALGRLLQGDMSIPAGLIRPAHSVIIADDKAASQS